MTRESPKEMILPSFPEKVTSPAERYFQTSSRNLELFGFIIVTVLSGDYASYIARQALDGHDIDKEIDPAILASSKPGPQTRQLRKYRQELLQAFFTRFVDNFEVYLIDILREVLRKKPEILCSRQQTTTLEYLLQFKTIDDLIQDIIESKVNSLSYKGFLDLEEWYEDNGIPLIVEKEHRQAIVELIATRNIIVHNRGLVDAKFLRTVTTSTHRLGELRKLEVADLYTTLSILNTIVSATDQKIAEKFNLTITLLNKKGVEK
jgi:hypothetical protein